MKRSNFLIRNNAQSLNYQLLYATHLVQALHVVVPQLVQVVNVVGQGIVRDVQTEVTRQLAVANAHLPVSLRVLLLYPAKADVLLFLTLGDVRPQCVVVGPELTPCQRDDAVLVLLDTVGQPALQPVDGAYLLPYQTPLFGCQRIL